MVDAGRLPGNGRGESHGSRGQRWAARAALALALASLAAPLIIAGLVGVVLLLIGVAGTGLAAGGLWVALSHRGILRTIGVAVAAVAILGVVISFIVAHFWWVVLVTLAGWLLADIVARLALRGDETRMPEQEQAPPLHPFMIMNPRSGGGRVIHFRLAEQAEALGARVALLDGPEHIDVAALAQDAVAHGADLLGVAGGDGTQALVAGVAAEHNVPFLVISAGTRNHFALDLGLDCDDPSRCLDALRDGVELRIDLGTVNGRAFVNNVSFGAYAAVVQKPEYRDDKTGTTLRELPNVLAPGTGARLEVHADEVRIEAPAALLVSNNPYGTDSPTEVSRRPRLDRGTLGVIGVRIDNALQAAGLVWRARSPGLTIMSATEVTVTADAPDLPAGVDGEALMLSTPVRCAIRPGALRVRVPRDRPGHSARPIVDWRRVRHLAVAQDPAASPVRSGSDRD